MSRWINGTAFAIGVILLIALARFVFEQWVMQAARDWHDHLPQVRFKGSPASWRKPWYVILDEKWGARRG